MVKVNDLISDFEQALSGAYPYESPGNTKWSMIQFGVDCSGLFVAAFGRHGGSIYHGSNTMARKYTTGLAKINKASDIRTGDVVYKNYGHGGEPAKYQNDGLGDFGHVGLCVSASPLRIIHASSASGFVTCDTKVGKWTHHGRLTGVSYDSSTPTEPKQEGDNVPYTAKVTTNLNVRTGIGTSYDIVGLLRKGELVTVVEESKGWCHVTNGTISGWSIGTALQKVKDAPSQTVPDASTAVPAPNMDYVSMQEFEAFKAQFDALVKRVEALESEYDVGD